MDSARRILDYERDYVADFGFERHMVAARQALLRERIERLQPKTVVEVGCGGDMLFDVVHEAVGNSLQRWTIVEPAPTFAAAARAIQDPRVEVHEGFFEEVLGDLDEVPPDLLLCSSLLHEVEDPRGFVAALREVSGPETILHVNVPNALSLHRRLARAMGLITDERQLGTRNRKLAQARVFDMSTLDDTLRGGGFTPTASGGMMLKPFTHAQMEGFVADAPASLVEGLMVVGRELPDIASEIWLEARTR